MTLAAPAPALAERAVLPGRSASAAAMDRAWPRAPDPVALLCVSRTWADTTHPRTRGHGEAPAAARTVMVWVPSGLYGGRITFRHTTQGTAR